MNRPVRDHEILSAVFAKMDVPAMTIAAGVLCSLLLFLATAILLLKAGPQNYPVGGFAAAVYWNLTHYVALGVMLISAAELAD
jgi:hypothetical protein